MNYDAYIPFLESLFPSYRVGGFDPGFLLIPREGYDGHNAFILPVNAAIDLAGRNPLDTAQWKKV